MRVRDGERALDLLARHVELFGDLLDRGLAAELLEEVRAAASYPVESAGAVERHPHDAALLGQRLEDRLADPPHGVADELDALRLVELMGRPDQTEVSLVDEVRERYALVLVLLRDGDDEAQ